MSENTTTDTDTAAQIPAAGTLEHVDPQTLEFETNVRDDDAALDADFVASIKEHGVLTPMAAVGRYDMVGSMGRVGACLAIMRPWRASSACCRKTSLTAVAKVICRPSSAESR